MNKSRTTLTTLLVASLGATSLVATSAQSSPQGENWSDWRAMSSGYVARKRQPRTLPEPALQGTARAEAVSRGEARLAIAPGTQSKTLAPVSVNTLDAMPAVGAWAYTDSDALFRVSEDNLAATLGVPVSEVQGSLEKGLVRITVGNKETSQRANKAVSWHHDADAGEVLFAGRGYETFWADSNAYNIKQTNSAQKARPMAVFEGEGPGVGDDSPIYATVKFEEEPGTNFLLRVIPDEPDADFWFWDYVSGGYKPSQTFNLDVPSPAFSGPAEIRIGLRGYTDVVDGDDHVITATLNTGYEIGQISFDGVAGAELVAEFDTSILAADGNNTLDITIHAADGTYPITLIDDITVSYTRLPEADNDQLWLRDVDGGVQRVSGFSTEDVIIIEKPEATAILRRDYSVEELGPGNFAVSFEAKSGVDYLVAARTSAATPGLAAEYNGNLRKRSNGADYLIIAPREFAQTAHALADYRGSQNQVKIAWLDDVYKNFSAGRAEPVALAKFMRRVQSHWQFAPTDVVLIGKGTVDALGRLNLAVPDHFMPIRLGANPHGATASDTRLLGYAENAPFAVGRLPIIHDAEGVSYVEKLEAHELAAANRAAEDLPKALLAADNPDDGGDFHLDVAQREEQLVYDLGFAAADVRTVLHQGDGNDLDADNDDVGSVMNDSDNWNLDYVSYSGHGSITNAGTVSEGFLDTAGATSLTNSRYPVFSALTCAVGDDTYPDFRSVAAGLVLNSNGGAIAALAATGLSVNADAQLIGSSFASNLLMFPSSVGVALRDAKFETDGLIADYMQRMYSIVGDTQAGTP
ncbi:hypothetical protein EY643_02370 [Halioglobus maricola]|uniref:Gingipain domain-containing protein n=1 Tax=Halioglobus maricola TaxID=2601894 RepID=A0A5P9NHV0_9GAMM|nr:C25 family cysteine peptidase [Halioglobus maricola]QFU74588.1 hypothetical protein EY643_02370 [Halioglobus maricola]